MQRRPNSWVEDTARSVLAKQAPCGRSVAPPSAFAFLALKQIQDKGLKTPFDMMDDCRRALTKLDGIGWYRSHHQRLFHEDFLKACTRIFWKTAPAGQFARDHHKILVRNGWEHLAQEILISTPRRFGKTISVSMFAAALIVSCPRVEVSIYSTCKRISQKLLRNIQKFMYLICDQELSSLQLRMKRENMEEIVLQGPLGSEDIRIVNSYPSKVGVSCAASTLPRCRCRPRCPR
jgi:hypothetical protein